MLNEKDVVSQTANAARRPYTLAGLVQIFLHVKHQKGGNFSVLRLHSTRNN